MAVTLGAGGLVSVSAESSQSVFVAITPQRVLDTRNGVGLTGSFVGGQARKLDVTGSVPVVGSDGQAATATVVPDGATAIVANVTALRSTSTGFVSVRPGTATGTPTTSNLNIPIAGGIYPNSVTVELPTTGSAAGQVDLFYFADSTGGTTELLLDIVGYYVEGAGTVGPQGPAGPTGAAGPTGPAGPQGERGFSAWDVIPSGTTVTGIASLDAHHPGNQSSDVLYIQLPGIAPAPLASEDVNFATPGFADSDPTCTGTTSAPTAPPGKVCVYRSSSNRIVQSSSSGVAGFLSTRAFGLSLVPDATGPAGADMYLLASWAYTAP